MLSLFAELKRRNVFRVAVAYLALAWLATEVVGTLFPAFGIPDWGIRLVVIVFALGFLPALIISWVYELTPEGIKREKDVVRDVSITHLTAKRLDVFTIGLIVVAIAFILFDRMWLAPRLERAPAPDTAAEIGSVQTAVSKPGAPQYSSNSIAVLPFANRSANPDDVFFVDGIHDDLLTYVSQISDLKVISRTSVMEYRDTLKKIPEIAQELGVTNLLEGGVQRAGDHVRINVQLIDAKTDEHVWSNIYDRELTAANVFAIQSEIALAIAEALRATLTPEEEERIQSVPTNDLIALEAYFLGRQLLAKRNVPALAEAIARFGEAVARDPKFALAHVGLADSTRLHSGYSAMGPDERKQALSRAREAVERALALNPMLGEAYAAMGSLFLREGKPEEAEAAFKRAIDLNPNYAPAYQWYGEWLGLAYRMGESDRLDLALELSRKAIALDPKSAIITNDYGEVLQYGGRYEEALAQFEKSVMLEPEFAPGLSRIMWLKSMIYGRLDEALLVSRRLVSANPTWRMADIHAYFYLELDDPEGAALWRDRAERNAPEKAVPDSLVEWTLHQGDLESQETSAREKLVQNPRSISALLLLDTLEWARDRPAEAIAFYREGFAELFAEENPGVTPDNLFAAVNLAALLRRVDEVEASDRLLEQGLSVIEETPSRQSDWAFCFAFQKARIHVIRGERAAALAAFPTVRDTGWWHYWWHWLRQDPVLKALHEEPRFQAVRSEIEAELSSQISRVREWEVDGKLAPVTQQ